MLLENLAMTTDHGSDPGYNNKKTKINILPLTRLE